MTATRQRSSARRLCLAVLFITTSSGACERMTPVTPSDPAPRSTPVALSDAVNIAAFAARGWYDGGYHYEPELWVAIAAGAGAAFVRQIEFTTVIDGTLVRLAEQRYNLLVPVPAGQRVLVLGASRSNRVTLTSATPLTTLMATVTFTNGSDQSATAQTQISPAVPLAIISTALALDSFSVEGWTSDGRHHYWPTLTLRETTGAKSVTVVEMTFTLLDVGPVGNVPKVNYPATLLPGETRELREDAGGWGPWLEIDSSARAERVSVTIMYIDSSNQGGVLTRIANVGRQ